MKTLKERVKELQNEVGRWKTKIDSMLTSSQDAVEKAIESMGKADETMFEATEAIKGIRKTADEATKLVKELTQTIENMKKNRWLKLFGVFK